LSVELSDANFINGDPQLAPDGTYVGGGICKIFWKL